MISSLTIQNFLSHETTEVELSPGVNIIVGPTDSGKSAIIKAIRWAAINRPMGDGMVSSWAGDASTAVELIVDGKSVIREKGKGINGYYLNDQKFSAIKGDVPQEVSNLLNLSELNLQTQFDSHFLLSKSPGEVAQIFNKIAHLDKIDVALQNIQRGSREAQRKLDYDKDSLKDKEERLLAYDSLPEIEALIKTLEEKENTCNRQALKRQEVLKLISSINKVEAELEEISFLADLEKSVVEVLETMKRLDRLEEESDRLWSLVEGIKETDNKLAEVDDFIRLEGKVNSLLELNKKQSKLKETLTALVMVVTSGKRLIKEIAEVAKELEEMEKLFHKELGKGSVCPLCEQVIK